MDLIIEHYLFSFTTKRLIKKLGYSVLENKVIDKEFNTHV
jgi:hypothetical protein